MIQNHVKFSKIPANTENSHVKCYLRLILPSELISRLNRFR